MRTAALLALLAVPACAHLSRPPVVWDTAMQPRRGSSVTGFGTATTVAVGSAARTEATVGISGALPGASHPWHIHSGTCESGGPIVGGAGWYPLLQVNASGQASVGAALPVVLETGNEYHLNVHASPQQMGTVVACGDLRTR